MQLGFLCKSHSWSAFACFKEAFRCKSSSRKSITCSKICPNKYVVQNCTLGGSLHVLKKPLDASHILGDPLYILKLHAFICLSISECLHSAKSWSLEAFTCNHANRLKNMYIHNLNDQLSNV